MATVRCSATPPGRLSLERLGLDQAPAVILTMDEPVLAQRITRKLRSAYPDLPIIARARDTIHAAELYRSGASTAVPETLESEPATDRGRAGRTRRGDGAGDRLDPREARRIPRTHPRRRGARAQAQAAGRVRWRRAEQRRPAWTTWTTVMEEKSQPPDATELRRPRRGADRFGEDKVVSTAQDIARNKHGGHHVGK